jgi:hypothetical protein
MPAPFPMIDAGRAAAAESFRQLPDQTRALCAAALGDILGLALAAPAMNAVSRRWLEKSANPYLSELRQVDADLGRRAAFALNMIYAWACSTAAGPDPDGGVRLVRVLDWGLTSIGRYSIVLRHEGDRGEFLSVGWPGYAGVLTGLAPGRFAAAINVTPVSASFPGYWANKIAGHLGRDFFAGPSLPAEHLLRQVFETEPDFDAAVSRLMQPTLLTRPAIFTLAGVAPQQACIIEAKQDRRRLHRAGADGIVATANDWQTHGGDWTGVPPRYAGSGLSPAEENARRRAQVAALFGRPGRPGFADLAAPILNSHTVHMVVANPARGTLHAQAIGTTGDGTQGVVLESAVEVAVA